MIIRYLIVSALFLSLIFSCKDERIDGNCPNPVKFSTNEVTKNDKQKQFKLVTDRKEFWLSGFSLNNQYLQLADLKDYQVVFTIDHQKDSQHIIVTFYENDRFENVELKFSLQDGNCFTSVSLKNN